jgi:hypothetical protein
MAGLSNGVNPLFLEDIKLLGGKIVIKAYKSKE